LLRDPEYVNGATPIARLRIRQRRHTGNGTRQAPTAMALAACRCKRRDPTVRVMGDGKTTTARCTTCSPTTPRSSGVLDLRAGWVPMPAAASGQRSGGKRLACAVPEFRPFVPPNAPPI
jgi:hypothetical protein